MDRWVHEIGHEGQEVKRLQAALGATTDGVFGPATQQSLQDYQSANNLIVDGRSGPQTRSSLGIEIYNGIDVSHHQGSIDWPTVKSSGLADFAWVKISEGVTYQDPKLKINLSEARASNIPVGGYHFARPDNNDDPKREVDNFVKHCDLRPGDLRPVFDLETARKDEPMFTLDWAHEFMTYAELKFGVMPILYTGGNFLKYEIRGEVEDLENYLLWHAYYPRDTSKGIPKSRMFNWDEWRIWQWTASGTIPGIKGKVDRNWLGGGKRNLDEIIVS